MMRKLALWGGVECTLNRVGDRSFCQLARSGHDVREADIARFASLGLQALRYPILWERTAPDGMHCADWSWADRRLQLLRQLRVEPIVGLVHHGSGPFHTNLADDLFPAMLADYAQHVAARYPWVERYTPVNEPLTTARFSGLYGFWYPHARSAPVFARALLNQCRAVVLSMRAIRKINPRAQLIQTDDLGRTHSTALLAYQAEFQNHLRWLAWDLLAGRVDREHALWHWLVTQAKVATDELAWFSANRCPADMIGINYYVTSERYLDADLDRYASCYHGGNDTHRYADIEAARVAGAPAIDLESLLHEAWKRYRTPLAITEIHIDAGREDQLRWLHEAWQAASHAAASGVDCRAVTVWALLGSYDWNTLVTQSRNYYEVGAFDVRSDPPRETAVAAMARELACGQPPSHPALHGAGWWRRKSAAPSCETMQATCVSRWKTAQPILIAGAAGQVGSAFAHACSERHLPSVALTHAELDIGNADALREALDRYRPWAFINAAGFQHVDVADADADLCYRANTTGPSVVAEACARRDMALVTFSSDLVFDGAKGSPYVEDDKTGPLGVYGQSKVLAEVAVREQHRNALIIRTSRLFSALRRDNFIALAIRALADGERFVAASDVFASPTYVPDLVHASLDLLIDRERGLWHLTNSCPISEVNVALVSARLAGVDAGSLIARRGRELRAVARYPAHSALTSRRAVLLPTVENALQRYIARCGVDALRSSRPVLSERRAVERPAGVHTLPSGTEALPLPSREELTAAATLSEGLA